VHGIWSDFDAGLMRAELAELAASRPAPRAAAPVAQPKLQIEPQSVSRLSDSDDSSSSGTPDTPPLLDQAPLAVVRRRSVDGAAAGGKLAHGSVSPRELRRRLQRA
jgi:hypothetical protein